MKTKVKYDVAVIGCGIAGMATALRLQAKGVSTIVLESHGQPGGCAGYFRKKGFSFDVGATTLVDFNEGGVGGEFFEEIGLQLPESDLLDYKLWLPDKEVHLFQNKIKWEEERLIKFSRTPSHIAFWKFIDHLADVFWLASRKGIKLPLQTPGDLLHAIKSIGIKNLHLARYLNVTMLDILKKYDLHTDLPLKGALSMLVEDTVHSTLDQAPVINAALGITIRGAGLSRAKGGMKGFWDHLIQHYRSLGGVLMLANKVNGVYRIENEFNVITKKNVIFANKVISAVPAEITKHLAPDLINKRFNKYLDRDRQFLGSAIVIFLGVPESEILEQELTHHQLLYDYNLPLGNGNNMFISVSSPGDIKSAPEGYRAVMLSTHCNIEDWKDLSLEEYQKKKNEIGNHLLLLARKVYPNLGKASLVYEVGTPHTYSKYTGRPNGAVGGVRQNLKNSNFNALPHNVGIKNFGIVGDSTWPGLGTVACILGSKIVAKQIMQ